MFSSNMILCLPPTSPLPHTDHPPSSVLVVVVFNLRARGRCNWAALFGAEEDECYRRAALVEIGEESRTAGDTVQINRLRHQPVCF